MAEGPNRALILYLRRQGWPVAQIAALLRQDDATIQQVGRAAPAQPAGLPGAAPTGDEAAAHLRVRLSADARRLELWLPADALSTPTGDLAVQITAACRHLGLPLAVSAEILAPRLRNWVYGTWLIVLEAEPPTPPTPDRIEVLVPVGQAARRARAALHLVRCGAVLARRHPGQLGRPGRDLLGHPIAPRAPHAAPLPQGDQTEVGADGLALLAAVDGEVVLRNLRLHVLPFSVHEGDVSAATGVVRAPAGLLVTGSVLDHGAVLADGDVHIRGQVRSSQVASALGSVRVEGPIGGTARDPSTLRAGADIVCGRVAHATLEAQGDVVVEGEVHYSMLVVGGNLHLRQPLERGLREVELSLGGGIGAPVSPVPPDAAPATERRHIRVPIAVGAHLALHGLPLSFTPCLIADLSPGGALCRFTAVPAGCVPEAIVQIKFRLPSGGGDVLSIARVVRRTEQDELGLAFLHITERDATRVAQFCNEELRTRQGLKAGSRSDRRDGR